MERSVGEHAAESGQLCRIGRNRARMLALEEAGLYTYYLGSTPLMLGPALWDLSGVMTAAGSETLRRQLTAEYPERKGMDTCES